MNSAGVDVTIDHDVFTGGNDPAKAEKFRDLALGMFIHWSCDSPLGLEISHPMVGASDDVLDRYEKELAPRFHPRRFDPVDYAELAEAAGMKYFCFTAKHHNGFCMFDTETTPFNVMNSRYGRDIVRMFTETFRRYGILCGLYFSPLDFHWLRRHGKRIRFLSDDVIPANNPGLAAYNREQVRELLTKYGPVDLIFFDGPPEGLKPFVWTLSPGTLITRGEMKTPEQTLPDTILDEPWEACHTLGGQWGWNSTMLLGKSPRDLVKLLIETRSRGGNLLLNVTPNPDGTIPSVQENALRELGLWLFWHRESVYETRPCRVRAEADGRIVYTQSKDGRTIYAHIMDDMPFDRGTRRSFLLKEVFAGRDSSVELLGQNGEVNEHTPPGVDVSTRFEQREDGLHIDAMRCLRPSGQLRYDMPFVIRISS